MDTHQRQVGFLLPAAVFFRVELRGGRHVVDDVGRLTLVVVLGDVLCTLRARHPRRIDRISVARYVITGRRVFLVRRVRHHLRHIVRTLTRRICDILSCIVDRKQVTHLLGSLPWIEGRTTHRESLVPERSQSSKGESLSTGQER